MHKWLTERLPLFYVFFSGFGFSIQVLIVKLLARTGFYATFVCVLARGIVQTAICLAIAYGDRTDAPTSFFGDTTRVKLIMFARSLVGFGGIAFSFLSVSLLPIGDSQVLVMLGPTFASFFSYLVLGEPWRFVEMTATVLSLTGATLVAKPAFIFGSDNAEALNITGVIYAFVAALSAGIAFVFVRILGTTAKMPWAHVCVAQASVQAMLAVPFLYIFDQKFTAINFHQFILILLGACIGSFSQILMTIGMQREKSAAATAMRMSDVVFGYLWQAMFTSDDISLMSIGGASMVTGSILLVVLTKQIASSSSSSSSSTTLPHSSSPRSISDSKDSGIVMSPINTNLSSPSISNSKSFNSKKKKLVDIQLPKVSFSSIKEDAQSESATYLSLPQIDKDDPL